MLENKIYFKGIKQDKSEILARALLYREPINKLESLKYVIKVDDAENREDISIAYDVTTPLNEISNMEILKITDVTNDTNGEDHSNKNDYYKFIIQELISNTINNNKINRVYEFNMPLFNELLYNSHNDLSHGGFIKVPVLGRLRITESILYTDKLNKSQEIHEIFNKNIATFLHCDVERIHYDKYNCSKR